MARRAGAAASGLDPARKRAMEFEVKELYDALLRAQDDLYIHMHRVNQAGLTTRDMEGILPVTQDTVSRWVRKGSAAREKRQRGATAPVEALSSDT